MLLEFKVENYLSFKEKASLSMLSSSSATSKKESLDAVIDAGKYKILSSAAIYGANASGKSNFLSAIKFVNNFIFSPVKTSEPAKEIKINNFKFNSVCDTQPSTFEMTFLIRSLKYHDSINDVVFRYGFQIDKEKILSEWLFARFTSQESKLFTRVNDEIIIGEKFIEGKQVYKATGKIAKTTLFLSLVDYIKGENAIITNRVIDWFSRLIDLSTIADYNLYRITSHIMEEAEMKKKIIRAFCSADICIEDIIIKEESFDQKHSNENIKIESEERGSEKLLTITPKSYHKKYNAEMKVIGEEELDFDKKESAGSKKFFAIIGPILDALRFGLVIIIDEIDARLHPSLCEELIGLFNSKKTNKNNAQLIFATHNTLIMHKKMLRRDQIYFVEKNKYGESEIYSLLDYKKVRSDASYDKDYLLGKYGAVPSLGNFQSLVTGA